VSQRPLDVLDAAKGDNVLVKLKPTGGNADVATASGRLKAFDLHLNMWLEDAVYETDGSQSQHEKLLIRGDNVIFASPE